MEASKTAGNQDAMSRNTKITEPGPGPRRPEEALRTDGGVAYGGDFDLKVTLQDTEVHESSYAEFLDLLKRSGRSPG
jgi:hypothetical protein